jgi:hypothetical protein
MASLTMPKKNKNSLTQFFDFINVFDERNVLQGFFNYALTEKIARSI